MSDLAPDAGDERTVLITRVFEAPREQVFRAWVDPDQVAAWFGPAHMRAPRERIQIDLRVGGRWELTMVRGDGGGEFSFGYEILELREPELLVMRSDPMPEMGMDEGTIIRLELHDHGEKTRMTLSDGPLPPQGREGAEAGWTAAFEQLATFLAD
ncbi:MAG TPA: SRPBCC domain-containing protein [Solirubrobacterales bacterium]|nr:SRPBCC domain-containing protein [Solirubrobacterales bacterium]